MEIAFGRFERTIRIAIPFERERVNATPRGRLPDGGAAEARAGARAASRSTTLSEPNEAWREGRASELPSRRRSEHGEQVAVGIGGGEEPQGPELPAELPVLPLKNTVLFPFLLSPLLVNTERSKQVIDAVLVSPERLMLAVGGARRRRGQPAAPTTSTASARCCAS